MFHVDWQLRTAGDGYWSRAQKMVRVVRLEMPYVNEEGTFGELRVYFDTDTWSIHTDGLIYTDSQFIDQLCDLLYFSGLYSHVDYSEQGMQGKDYVSLDVGEEFVRSFRSKIPVLA